MFWSILSFQRQNGLLLYILHCESVMSLKILNSLVLDFWPADISHQFSWTCVHLYRSLVLSTVDVKVFLYIYFLTDSWSSIIIIAIFVNVCKSTSWWYSWDSNSPRIFRTLLSIPANLNKYYGLWILNLSSGPSTPILLSRLLFYFFESFSHQC